VGGADFGHLGGFPLVVRGRFWQEVGGGGKGEWGTQFIPELESAQLKMDAIVGARPARTDSKAQAKKTMAHTRIENAHWPSYRGRSFRVWSALEKRT
jgi:hypothetical protein